MAVINKFDLCVIGCGPGGWAAASRAIDFGKTVCIVESGEVGGYGIFNGAMTSKTMWELARDYSIAAKVDRGYRAASLSVDFSAVRKTIIQAAKEKQYQILSQIESFNPEKKKKGSLTLLRGRGRFVSDTQLEVFTPNGLIRVEADYFVVATGSRPRPYPNIEFDEERIISSDGILRMKRFPARMMIIGAGIIGCEFATMFSYFDQTKVYLLDRQPRVIPFEDHDVSDIVSHNLEERNVTILHNANLRDIVKYKNHLEVIIDFDDGHSKVVEVDIALISIGRWPNTRDLNLEGIGIPLKKFGHLTVDADCCLKDNIYAVGDVTGRSALVNLAEMEGRYVVEKIYGVPEYPLNYNNKSTIMFFRPEVAAVGLNEKKCRLKSIPHRVAHIRMNMINRAIAMRNTNGFVKIIVTLDEKPKILGMRAVGPRASDLIITIAIAIDHDMDLGEMLKTVHPHPSTSEALQACLRMLAGHSIFKPEVFPEYMQIREWHPDGSAAPAGDENNV